jgi:hypothetical protein
MQETSIEALLPLGKKKAAGRRAPDQRTGGGRGLIDSFA